MIVPLSAFRTSPAALVSAPAVFAAVNACATYAQPHCYSTGIEYLLVNGTLALDDVAYQGLVDSLDQMRMTRRSPRLEEVAATAAFLASEKAGAITGTFVNVTSGTFPS